MVEIISKRRGPRREDLQAQRLIEQNRGTIERLADHLTGGARSSLRAQHPAEPRPEGLIIHVLGKPTASDPPQPYVRISPNDRVILADADSGRQLHHLGELRRVDGERRFVLATRENGFFAPLDAQVGAVLADLDGATLGQDLDEERLAAAISERLGVP